MAAPQVKKLLTVSNFVFCLYLVFRFEMAKNVLNGKQRHKDCSALNYINKTYLKIAAFEEEVKKLFCTKDNECSH